jgi:hypothetical protein
LVGWLGDGLLGGWVVGWVGGMAGAAGMDPPLYVNGLQVGLVVGNKHLLDCCGRIYLPMWLWL